LNTEALRQTGGVPYTLTALPYEPTPYPLFKKLRHLPLPVLLASGNDRSRKDTRFEYLTAAPDTILRTRDDKTQVKQQGTSVDVEGNPLQVLADRFPLESVSHASIDLPFTGGAIGYFGYELLHAEHRIADHRDRDISLPDMLIGIYSWVIVIDHKKQITSLVIRDSCPANTRDAIASALAGTGKVSGGFGLDGDFTSNFSRDAYQAAYQRVIEYILSGDCYQVNLTQRFTAACHGDPYTAFTRLQTIAKAPFAAFMEDGDNAVLSFSPERFLQVKNRQVMTQPIKGTRPRNPDPAIDLRNKTELEASLKDRAENLMIVDLLRNDIARMSEVGSVKVPELFAVESFATVHQMSSRVQGRLLPGAGLEGVMAALFPCGSITGAPKIRAMQIIAEVEAEARGVYCGALGWAAPGGAEGSVAPGGAQCWPAPGGAQCWSVGIRTLRLWPDGEVRLNVGGGVVYDSTAQGEWEEALWKARYARGLSSRG
jgi:para-aminobenzoate synthetase component 1